MERPMSSLTTAHINADEDASTPLAPLFSMRIAID